MIFELEELEDRGYGFSMVLFIFCCVCVRKRERERKRIHFPKFRFIDEFQIFFGELRISSH